MAALLLLAVWLSGAAALIAEVVWFRGLGRGVGTSAEALAVVSAAFLGGLGIGAAVSSRRAPKARFPLRSAAYCEGIAGVLVFLSPYAIALVPGAHLAVLSAFGLEPGRSSWPAALVALPILILPTAFLGATLPLLVRSVVTTGVTRAGRWTGWLYGVNTLGAMCGTGTAVLFLLPNVGEILSLRVASGCNLLAAALILLAERPSDVSPVASSTAADALPLPPPTAIPNASPPAGRPSGPPGGRARASIPELALFASGLFALGAEVAWFRLLEPLTGVHLYGFAILLGGVLLGTAIGGAMGGIVADRVKRPDLALSTVIAAAGFLTIASIWVAGSVPWLAMRSATAAGEAARAAGNSAAEVSDAIRHALFATRLCVATLCVAPPLAAYAMAYPLAVRVRATDPARAVAAVGSTYAWNTAGNMIGSLFAGFLLLPAVGGPRTLAIFGGLALAAAVALRLIAARPRRVWPAWVPLAGLALLALPGSAERIDLAGPTLPETVALDRFNEHLFVRSRADAAAFGERMGGTFPRPAGRPFAPPVLPREGVMSNVGVLQEGRYVRLRQGALSESRIQPSDPDAGSETEVALSLVPYLAHPNPKKALCIGHGAGWTPETLLSTPMPWVDVAEIESAILDVMEAYRGGPLLVRTAANAHLHITDGRLMLRLAAAKPAGERYDVIVSQPSHPWVPGAGHLFTREAYALARSALNEGGVFSQWLNVFSMTRDLLQTALKAWYAVFPDCWVMRYYDELVLVGFTGTSTIDVPRWTSEIASGLVGVRARAAGIEGPADLVRHIALDGEGLGRMLPTGFPPPATDDDPRLELGLAWVKFAGVDGDARENEKNAIYADLQAGFPARFERIIPNPRDRDQLLASVVWGLLRSNQTDEARRWLRGGGPVAFEGGVLGKRVRAKESLLTARSTVDDAAKRSAAERRGVDLLRAALVEASDDADADVAVELGEALLDQGRADEAAKELVEPAKRHPNDGRILSILGRALISMDRGPEAEQAFSSALLAKSPRAPQGTGTMLARVIDSATPRRPSDARAALRADPSTFSDLDALAKLRELEIEIGEPGVVGLPRAVAAIDEAIATVERRRGREKLETALAWYSSNTKDALEQAREATNLLPDDPAAWQVRGWLELRSKDTGAASSFQKSLSLEKPENCPATRARIESWYRLHGRDPSELGPTDPTASDRARPGPGNGGPP